MAADNILTSDREVLVATLADGLEVDFARLLISVIHESAFKASTTYPFPCMIFQLCGIHECSFGIEMSYVFLLG